MFFFPSLSTSGTVPAILTVPYRPNYLVFIIPFYAIVHRRTIEQIYYTSKILGGVVFCMSVPKHLFIFYNSFSLRLTENLHKQNIFSQHYLHVLFTSFFCKLYNKEKLFTAVQSP